MLLCKNCWTQMVGVMSFSKDKEVLFRDTTYKNQ